MNPTKVSGKKKTLNCSVCVTSNVDGRQESCQFVTADHLWAHIATTHLFWHPFECALCSMVFMPSEGVLKQHYEQFHPKSIPKAIYIYDEEKKAEIRQIFLTSQQLSDVASDIKVGKRSEKDVEQQCHQFRRSDKRFISGLTEEEYQKDQTNKKQRQRISPWNNKWRAIGVRTVANNRTPANSVNTDPAITQSGMKSEIRRHSVMQHQQTETPGEDSLLCLEKEAEMAIEVADEEKGLNEEIKSESVDFNIISADSVPVNHIEPNSSQQMQSKIPIKPKLVNATARKATEATKSERKIRLKEPVRPEITCRLCQKKMTSRHQAEHIWWQHSSGYRFSCDECGHRMMRVAKIKEHIEMKHKAKPGIGWTDHAPEMQTQFRQQYEAAFTTSHAPRRRI